MTISSLMIGLLTMLLCLIIPVVVNVDIDINKILTTY